MLTYCQNGQFIITICISAMRSLGWWSLVGCWCVLKWVFLCNGASASNGLKADALSLSFSLTCTCCGLISWPFSCLSLYHSFSTAKLEHLLYVCAQPLKLPCCHSGFCCYEVYTIFKALGRLLQEITAEIWKKITLTAHVEGWNYSKSVVIQR